MSENKRERERDGALPSPPYNLYPKSGATEATEVMLFFGEITEGKKSALVIRDLFTWLRQVFVL